ncbi:hypothetical protein B0E45_04640 [Sinorhizobium sp. A49]|uniref:hypothetical protein n=1 Tax=Sinorhizobium sp. A49 TaxID=1945861 RepID=UPI000986204F|nr:hypothetical protein [Sinorhizobium sp. A49]OOG74695.1 hypothetical protein B0E45_04640 [Sinorhizobium sp. A49]
MYARVATISDLDKIFAAPAQRCIEDLEGAGSSLGDAEKNFRTRQKIGDIRALFVKDDEVTGLISWQRREVLGSLRIRVYFIGAEDFFAPEVPSTRFGRKYMRTLQCELGNLPMLSMCWITHPKVDRWYRLMGYRLAETYGRQRNFVLEPKQ